MSGLDQEYPGSIEDMQDLGNWSIGRLDSLG
jgi:hypothetical protein